MTVVIGAFVLAYFETGAVYTSPISDSGEATSTAAPEGLVKDEPTYFYIAFGLLILVLGLALFEGIMLYLTGGKVLGRREGPDKLSNGDENEFNLQFVSTYAFPVLIKAYDELPEQLQRRDVRYRARVPARGSGGVAYSIRPVRRGEYHFGTINAFASTYIGFIERRFPLEEKRMVPCYPSYMQNRRYELLAMNNRLTEIGIKKLRRLGHSMEFEQIREYVEGDDFRTINWKATARRAGYMVNQYTDERSQPVYCLIDKGRAMKMPFNGMTLLDYAINATLVMSNIAIYKQDRAGVITFGERMGSLLKASRKPGQMHAITELLYRQKTRYLESDFGVLYANMRRKVNHRSLVLLFTNFETLDALRRQLPYLRRMARDHLLVVIFFENTELRNLLDKKAEGLSAIYDKTIAEKFAYEKRQIVKELEVHGIQSVMTAPENLTVNTLNKYVELKSRGLI